MVCVLQVPPLFCLSGAWCVSQIRSISALYCSSENCKYSCRWWSLLSLLVSNRLLTKNKRIVEAHFYMLNCSIKRSTFVFFFVFHWILLQLEKKINNSPGEKCVEVHIEIDTPFACIFADKLISLCVTFKDWRYFWSPILKYPEGKNLEYLILYLIFFPPSLNYMLYFWKSHIYQLLG